MSADAPVISILLLTYQHEAFVRDALDGIFAQQLSVPYEVIATEDCSSDKTRSILEEYRRRHAGVLRILARDRRVGGKRNVLDGFAQCRGDYICILDGDDYWTDATKLSRQLDLLQGRPEYVACAHNTRVVYLEGGKPDGKAVSDAKVRERYTIGDLASGRIYLHLSSLLFRNVFKGGLPAAQRHPRVGDYFLSMLFAEHGDIAFINRPMSVYRVTGHGEWSKLNTLEQEIKNLDGLVIYNRLLGYRYADLFDDRIYQSAKNIVRALRRQKPRDPVAFYKYRFLRSAYRPRRRRRPAARRAVLTSIADWLWSSVR